MSRKLRQATLLFLEKDNKILLAMKKRGFGVGKFNGVGGKPERGESIEKTAIRECQEEINVTPDKLTKVAILDFIFHESKSDWNQQVHVYLSSEWSGEPSETDEMKPEWFSVDDIPYEKMWVDDQYWLPEVLKGKFINASFEFDKNENISKYNIEN